MKKYGFYAGFFSLLPFKKGVICPKGGVRMEEKNTLYETLFIVNNQLGEEAIKATVERFTTLISENGTVETSNEWGARRLAYPIDDMTEGYYVLIRFFSGSDFPAELKRLFNINDSILRSLIIKVEV